MRAYQELRARRTGDSSEGQKNSESRHRPRITRQFDVSAPVHVAAPIGPAHPDAALPVGDAPRLPGREPLSRERRLELQGEPLGRQLEPPSRRIDAPAAGARPAPEALEPD